MALLPRERRDTPAQDRVARQRATDRAYQTASSGTRRDTPAQQRNLSRQQTPAQGRNVARERIDRAYQRADEVGRQQAANPAPGTLRAGINRAASAIRNFLPGAEPGDTQGLQQNFGPDDTGPDQFTPAMRRVGGFIADQARNNGAEWLLARPELLGQTSRWLGGQMDDMGLIPEWAGGGGGAGGQQPSAMGGGVGPNGLINPAGSQRAMDMARGLASGQGYAIGPDGRTQFFEGTQRNSGDPRNLSVMGNMGAAADEFARANAIRQEMIDSQRPQNQVTVIGGGGGNDLDAQIERLAGRAERTRDPWSRAAINRQISQLQQVADRSATRSSGQMDRDNALAVQQLRNQGAMATTLAGSSGGLDPYDMARTAQIQQEMAQAANPLATQRPTLDMDQLDAIQSMPEGVRDQLMSQYLQRFENETAQADLNQYLQLNQLGLNDALESFQAGDVPPDSELGRLLSTVYGGTMPTNDQTEDFAGGGLVPEMSALSFAQGGMVPDQYGAQMGPGMDTGTAIGMAAPGSGGIDMMQMEYDQYARGAQQLGVPAIPFEEFVGLKQRSIPQAPAAPGATQPMTGAMQSSAMNFADGGMVPGQDRSDTSGKMIVDPNPQSPQDSIPAVIDGQRPAKLDSGEFVIPKHVVMWHGIDKLNKLIAQAEEKGQGNGTESGAAGAGKTATGSAQR